MADKSLSNPQDNRQLSIFEPQFDSRIRREEINGETHFSILDVFQHYGNKANPTQSWKATLKALEKQGFERSTQIVEHQFPGQGQRKTPVATFKTFLRIAQAADIADWEHIRVWMAQVAHERLEEAVNYQRTVKQIEDKHQSDIVAYQLSGHNREWSERRVDSKDTQKNLNATLYATHVDHTPNYGEIGAAQNRELLGMTKRSIIEYLDLSSKESDKWRDHLGYYALQALTLVNATAERYQAWALTFEVER